MNQKIGLIIGVLVLIVIMLLGYIAIGKYNETRLAKDQIIIAEGYGRAVEDIFFTVAECKQIPLTYRNISLTLIAAECLQRSG